MILFVLLAACNLAENQNVNFNSSILSTEEYPSETPEQVENILALTPEATETVVEIPVDDGLSEQEWAEICESLEIEDCILTLTNYCDLPCLWGIVPGSTQVGAFNNFVEAFDLYSEIRPINEKIRYWTSFPLNDPNEGFQSFGAIANFFVEENSETILWNYYRITKNFANADNLLFYEEYLPKEIFEKYGTPSRISFYIGIPSDPPLEYAGYGLELYYDHLGFVIRYRGAAKYTETLDICFSGSKDPAFPQEIFIYSKSAIDQVFTLEEVMNSIHQADYFLPSSKMFDELISMDIDEFVSLFDGENPEVCFLIDLDAVLTFTEE